MSIVNKAAEESIRQSRLFSQLSDLSYKAVNGKRQNIRDFASGILNIGKLGEQMDVPKDEITKDMILDYKREQEEKLYDGNKRYQQTGLPDLQEYKPLYSGDEVDFEGQKTTLTNLQDLRKKYINMSKAIESEIIEIKKRLDYFLAITGGNKKIEATIPEIKYKTEELATKKAQKERILKNLSDVEDQFRTKYAQIQQTKQNIKANETEKIKIRDENKQLMKDFDEKFNLLNRDRISVTKQPNETDEQYFQRLKELEATTVDPNIYKEKAALEEIKKLKRNLKDILKDPSKIEDIIKSFPNPQDLYIININWKKISEFLKSKYGVINRFATIKEYIDEITQAVKNIQSSGYNVTQTKKLNGRQPALGQPQSESPILSLSVMNPILARQVALRESIPERISQRLSQSDVGSSSLPSASLSLMPRDIAQQEDIARTRAAEAEVQARAAQATIQAMSFGETMAASSRPGAAAGPEDEYQLYDFVNESNNTLFFISDNGQRIFIKIGKFNRKLYILYSLSGDENSFNSIEFDDKNNPNYIQTILLNLGLINENFEPNNMYIQIFGSYYSKRDIYNHLKSQLELKETTGLKERTNSQGKTIIGWGLKKNKSKKVIKGRGMQQIDENKEFEHKEEIPKMSSFGKNKILLNKLFYRNILSVKDKKGHSVENLPNTVVSDDFVKIIINMSNNDIKNFINDFNKLDDKEQDLMNLLFFISGLSKDKNIDIKRSENIKKLKDRLILVEAELKAGNNNPVVKKELKEIVNKLYLFGAISLLSAKTYIKQF
jgi:hypothetical protein